MTLFGKVAYARRRINSLRYLFQKVGPKSRGLSGEHIGLCAEGARRYAAESLRQTDGDAEMLLRVTMPYSRDAVLIGRTAFFGGILR